MFFLCVTFNGASNSIDWYAQSNSIILLMSACMQAGRQTDKASDDFKLVYYNEINTMISCTSIKKMNYTWQSTRSILKVFAVNRVQKLSFHFLHMERLDNKLHSVTVFFYLLFETEFMQTKNQIN